MAKRVTFLIIKDEVPVNGYVLSDENSEEWIANYDGKTVVVNPEDEFRSEFITLTDCIAVNVTGLDPMPGIGNGWKYVDGEWIPPVFEENEIE
jgi:hypothetical protein